MIQSGTDERAALASPVRARALLIEPTPALAKLIRGMLEQFGFSVTETPVVDAFAMAARPVVGIDLLITELALPDISANTLISFMQARKPTAKTLVLYEDEPPSSMVRDAKIALLKKPFSRSELSTELRRWFATPE